MGINVVDIDFEVDPGALAYTDDLRTHGVAYHPSFDFLDIVDKNNLAALDQQTVSWYSPCNLLALLQEYHGKKIVGIRFENVAEFLNCADEDPFLVRDGLALLEIIVSCFAEWKSGQTSQQIRKTQKMHLAARRFLLSHEESSKIPDAIHTKIVAAWKMASSPSPSLH